MQHRVLAKCPKFWPRAPSKKTTEVGVCAHRLGQWRNASCPVSPKGDNDTLISAIFGECITMIAMRHQGRPVATKFDTKCPHSLTQSVHIGLVKKKKDLNTRRRDNTLEGAPLTTQPICLLHAAVQVEKQRAVRERLQQANTGKNEQMHKARRKNNASNVTDLSRHSNIHV